MSESELEELQQLADWAVQEWPQIVVAVLGIALFILLIIFSIKFIQYKYRKAIKENEKFAERALTVTGNLIGYETKSRRESMGYKDADGYTVYQTVLYHEVTYGYCVNGVDYTVVYERTDTLQPNYDKQHEFLYEQDQPDKVHWSKENYKPKGKSVAHGCLLCIVVGFIIILLLGLVLKFFNLN